MSIMRNRFGELFSLTSFGESHGPAIGGVIDGMPAGISIDLDEVQRFVARRRPGQSSLTTARNEADRVEVLSGIYEGKTLGTPIGFIVRNRDQHSGDYSEIARCYRPSHADFTYQRKYGLRDPRGGGRSSARETASRVVAGALAMQALRSLGIGIVAYTSQIGQVRLDVPYRQLDLTSIDSNPVRCPHDSCSQQMAEAINRARSCGDSLGGIVSCVIKGVPVGLGEPVFGKLHSQLAAAMMSINAAKGFDYGLGFDFACSNGSDVLDHFEKNKNGNISTSTNFSGGIQGGISNGEDIYFRVAFKPVATLMQDVATIDTQGNPTVLHPHGRHDPCVVPRAVPIVEAMAAMVILDNYLLNKTVHL